MTGISGRSLTTASVFVLLVAACLAVLLEAGNQVAAAEAGVTPAAGSDSAIDAALGSQATSLAFSTFFGGESSDPPFAVEVDGSGNIYLLGDTSSRAFNVATVHDYRSISASGSYVFVAKFSPDAREVLWITLFGGNGYDLATALAVTPGGVVYAGGSTESDDLVTKKPFEGYNSGCHGQDSDCAVDSFLFKLDPQGLLLRSTYLGGAGRDQISDLALDARNNLYVNGHSTSEDLAVKKAFQSRLRGDLDLFVAKFARGFSRKVYLTYLGGSGYEAFPDLAALPRGSVVTTSTSGSRDFPTRRPMQPENRGDGDAVIARLSSDGQRLIYSTYLGGPGSDSVFDIALDPRGRPVVAGSTTSASMRQRSPFQPSHGGDFDGFVARLSRDGRSLGFYSFLGGVGDDHVREVAAPNRRTIYATGSTFSTNFPVKDAYQDEPSGTAFCDAGGTDCPEVFVSKVRPGELLKSTYLGGSAVDFAFGLAALGGGEVLVAGNTRSPDFPTKEAVQPVMNGVGDAFLTKLSQM